MKAGILDFEKRFKEFENRLLLLEQKSGMGNDLPVFEMDLTLPEAYIGGLHFNETRVHAVFERHDDGWYQSRDILFMSARNVIDSNRRDILTEYLNSHTFRDCIRQQLPEEVFGEVLNPDDIKVSLPEEIKGVKKYNGVGCWYWLLSYSEGSVANFSYVTHIGNVYIYTASAVGGCAPAFRVVRGGNQ